MSGSSNRVAVVRSYKNWANVWYFSTHKGIILHAPFHTESLCVKWCRDNGYSPRVVSNRPRRSKR